MELQMTDTPGTRGGARGFSLAELLVALVFTAFLMAGMAKVFQSSVRTYTAVNETMGTQRTNRWALDQISDDISQAGFVFPDRVLPTIVTSGSESLFSITPGQTVTCTRVSDTNPGATQNETITYDAFQFFTDVPLPIAATWSADTQGEDNNADGSGATAPPTSVGLTYSLGDSSDLKADDMMVVLDSGEKGFWDMALIAGPGNPVSFETDTAKITAYMGGDPLAPGIRYGHKAGVPVNFIRPAQLVRYTVQAVALDPSNTAVKIPCLVRQQTNYPASGSVTWSGVSTQIVAENVSGFRVDLSFDGGTTWARTTSSPTTWAGIQTNANTQLASKGLPGYTSITDPANPDWFRNINCLIRVDITTRSPIRREEYSTTTGSRAYQTRTQTLMISPRNFGVGK